MRLLIIHDSDDTAVAVSTSREMARSFPARVELFEVPDAGHCESWNADQSGYESHLGDLLDHLAE